MASSPPSRLTALQRDLLDGFFAREQRLFLTGGGALAGFYFGHRFRKELIVRLRRMAFERAQGA